MKQDTVSTELMDLLNQAIARELHVCVQYMLQHGVGAGRRAATTGGAPSVAQDKFIESHASLWLPGATLKKVAITEMRHAEAIAERVARLGGDPTTEPGAIALGHSAREMLENDLEQEREAIALYRKIIELAEREHDDVTRGLFQGILSDEEKHHRTFSALLE